MGKDRLHEAAEHLLANIDELSTDYETEDDYWKYYRSISGWIDNEYFFVYFKCGAMGPAIKICFTTDCEDDVREILKEWSDLIIENWH